MSAASRARELTRFHLAKRRGHPTWLSFFAVQRAALIHWRATIRPSLIAANEAIAFFAWEDGRAVSWVEVADDSPPFEGNTPPRT